MLKLFSLEKTCNKITVPLQWIVMLAIGILVLAIRNPDPLLNPIMYTEDGQWIGLALTKGWLHAFINAKDGYFVWGNLLLLFAAERSSNLLCGNSIICLPQAIAILSYAFFSLVAVLAWHTTQSMLPQLARIILFTLLLLMPLGDSSNEIIGRLSNIGYLLVFVSALLIVLRCRLNSREKCIIDFLLIICSATNPVCIPIIILAPLIQFLQNYPAKLNFKSAANDLKILSVGLVAVVTWMAWRALTAHGTSVTGTLQLHTLTEVALARSILYPFVFSWYRSLTNEATIVITLMLVFIGLLMFSFVLRKDVKILTGTCAFALIVFMVMTLVMRQSLTEQLGDYKTTFPDRYFMGLNYIVLFIFVLLAGHLLKHHGFSRAIGAAALITMVFIFVTKIPWLVEFREPRMKISLGTTFREEICLSGLLMNGGTERYLMLPILSRGWEMKLPTEIVQDALKKTDCSVIWRSFFISDASWNRGVAKNWAGFFVPNRQAYTNSFKPGAKVRFSNGEVREVVRQDQSEKYLNVFLDGKPLDVADIDFPRKIEVLE